MNNIDTIISALSTQIVITPEILNELRYQPENADERTKMYMGMCKIGEHRTCVSVGYTFQYAVKKAIQAIDAISTYVFDDIIFDKIHVVKFGETDYDAIKIQVK